MDRIVKARTRRERRSFFAYFPPGSAPARPSRRPRRGDSPLFRCRYELLLALRGGRVAGRVMVGAGPGRGRGFLARFAADDPPAGEAILRAAIGRCAALGCEYLSGPVPFAWHDYGRGVLAYGDRGRVPLLCADDPSWGAELFERCGFSPSAELRSYSAPMDAPALTAAAAAGEWAARRFRYESAWERGDPRGVGAAIREAKSSLNPRGPLAYDPRARAWKRLLAESEGARLATVSKGGARVGYAIALRGSGGRVRVATAYVAPSVRGRGAAAALLAFLIREFRVEGVETLELSFIDSGNGPSRRLAERLCGAATHIHREYELRLR